MKQQLIILSLALMCSNSILQGQELSGTVTCLTPRAIDVTCLSNDALHPMPGTPYSYAVNIPTPPGEKTFKWIVTQEQTFLTDGVLNLANAESAGGTYIAAAGAELNSTTAGAGGESIDITWKSFSHDPAKPVFVVIYVENTDGCTTQNLKVFQIQPQTAFTLDIVNLNSDGTLTGYGDQPASCVSDIASATYDASAADGIAYDFGTDYLFYVVSAANFAASWQPSFQLTGISGTQEATTEWAYPDSPGIWNPAGMVVTAKNPTGAVDAAGECIIVRVKIRHHSEEILAALSISLAVDGLTNLAAPLAEQKADLHHTGAECGVPDGFSNDIATHILKPRPLVQKLQ
jgi:hypothetical protein